ncbi:hypothetical protein KV205_25815 [Streptomyces sp. SKN60]|uniref:hypothetical protein n=1 Tax=Streptomyces sp. SKN60 TaxID=2855506 RepID=UPI0022451EDC|nr:hypothetical protein [Streptomyces sp. SKN60]MCX2183923.1 hypothetical protein [Streptomyces sp. SKN60]
MGSADYTRIASLLPPVYQEDALSFAQLDAFLGLVDELNHAYLERLEDLGLVLGPDAALRWPAGLPLDAGGDALIDAYLAVYDEIARRAAFTFPDSWRRDEKGVVLRRRFLARSGRIWRRRGTPRGFLDWFCLAFGIAPVNRPYLLEHFKVPGPRIAEPELTGTLFVPAAHPFTEHRRRVEAVGFVDRYAPAHVALRVCWTECGWAPPQPPDPPEPGPDGDLTPGQRAAFDAEVDQYRRDLRALLCSTTSYVGHGDALRLREFAGRPRIIDRLDVGHLPGEE